MTKRDAELDAAIEIFVRQAMAEGYSREQAVEYLEGPSHRPIARQIWDMRFQSDSRAAT